MTRTALPLLAAAIVAGPIFAQHTPTKAVVDASRMQVMGLRQSLGLDDNHEFAVRRAHRDELGQTHTRMNQLFRGVKVWEGEVIAHADAEGNHRDLTAALLRNVSLATTPVLSASEALGQAHADLNPQGTYASTPTAELVVFPVKMNGRPTRVVRYALAYHVHTELENGAEETAHTDYMVDAHSGAILKKWSTLHTTDAVGTANTQFSGTVSIHTNLNGSTYELNDTFRGMNIKTYDLNHGTGSGTGTLYTDADNTWGNGTNYTGSTTSTTSATGQTAAVDAHYGIEMTYDFYKNVLGRNGIDGNNRATYSRVHYSTSYDNAFWSDTCFCMTYGDGSSFKSLESMDVAGHEMTHGVCANSADLTYSGESGGLNEANSDMFGNMVELYTKNNFSLPATVANTDNCWKVGEALSSTPLRYMYKPSLDGSSPNAWSSSTGGLDVHYSSGPANRMFFFLSQGASATSSSDYYSSYTPSGFTGIGPEKAIKIWYRALTTYMTSSTNYAGARTACISAVKDLYTAGGAEEQAVWNAFAAINVGSAWSTTPPPPPPPANTFVELEPNETVATADIVARTYTAIQGNLTATTDKDYFALTLNPGEKLDIAMTGPSGVDWDLKLVDAAGTQLTSSTGSTATENLTYTNSGTTSKTVYANVYVYSGTSATAYNLALTYTGGTPPPPADTTAPTATATETGTSGTITLSATATDNVGVTKIEFYVDNVLKGTGTTNPSSMTLDSTTLTNGTHTLVAKAYDAAGNVGSSTAVNFTITNTTPTGTELILNGGFESGATSWTGTTAAIGTFTGQVAYEGVKNAWICGNGRSATEYLYQTVTIPSSAATATLTFYLHIDTAETTTSTAYDKLVVSLQSTSGTTLKTLATYSNLNKVAGYVLRTFDVSAYKGQTIRVYFKGTEDSSLQTSFVLDKVSLFAK